MLPSQYQIQQSAQRVDSGAGGDGATFDLLWRRESRGERPLAFACESSCHRRRRFIFEKLGNPEVEQLDMTVVRDEHGRRLDVAVDNQVGVRVRNGRQDVQK